MLLLDPTPTCADAGPDLCPDLYPDLRHKYSTCAYGGFFHWNLHCWCYIYRMLHKQVLPISLKQISTDLSSKNIARSARRRQIFRKNHVLVVHRCTGIVATLTIIICNSNCGTAW